jgi:hypothetical protein
MIVDELLKDPEISEMVEEIEWLAWLMRVLPGGKDEA